MQLVEDIHWVGAIDWSLRQFHGYTTDEGTSYNAYLLMDEHPTLIDGVKVNFAEEMYERVSNLIDPAKIEYIVVNHAESDHTGALPFIMEKLVNAKIVTNKICADFLQILYPQIPKERLIVAHSLNTGKFDLQFVLVPLLHWPESQFSYCPQKELLFSNDGFGQHFSSSERFYDQCQNKGLILKQMHEYTANILGCCQAPLQKALQAASTISIKTILTAHGVSWRGDDVKLPLQFYSSFASNQHLKEKISIIFYSVNGETKRISSFLAAKLSKKVSFVDLKAVDLTKCALEAFDSKYLAFGTPMMRWQMVPQVEAALQYLRGLHMLKGRKVILFSQYCWVEKALEEMSNIVKNAGGEVVLAHSSKLRGDFEAIEAALQDIL